MQSAKERLAVSRRRVLQGAAASVLATSAGPFGRAAEALGLSRGEAPDRIVEPYRAVYEDTLLDLARRKGLGYVEMVAANPRVDPWLPGEGTEIALPTVHLIPDVPREGIAVNLAEMRLYWFGDGVDGLRTFPLGIGREGRGTPTGSTTVTRKAENPTWYPPESIRRERPELPAVFPPGPDNPLGHRAIYLGWPAYLIHGTHQPYGVGRRVSAGCIRMYPEDVERLYELVPIGTRVTVVDQEVKFAWVGGHLYMEAHTSQRQADQLELDGRFEVHMPARMDRMVKAAAGEAAQDLDWTIIRQAALSRPGYPVRLTRLG
jgi:L,D-transpeptidase ErfK/SrfK